MHTSRKKDEVIDFLREFPSSSSQRIIGITIDMWEPYKLAIEAALPHVYVVIDAFHLIQASTKALDGVRKAVQTKLNKEQALAMKQEKELFTTPIEALSEDERERLQAWEEAIPELAKAISLHQKLKALYRCRDFEEGLELLADWEKEVLATDLESFHRLLKTVWRKTRGSPCFDKSLNPLDFPYITFVELCQIPRKLLLNHYIQRERVEEAKKLLNHSNDTISVIGARLAFYDQAHFIKVFKKHAGITPKQYRNRNRTM